MIIKLDNLIDILMRTASWGDNPSPQESLGIDFDSGDQVSKTTVTYHTADGGLLVIDLNDSGKAIGIEIH